MSLILTIGGVTALLMRNVFLPIQRLRTYIDPATSKNETPPSPPPHLPHDLDSIAANYYKLMTKSADKKENSQ